MRELTRDEYNAKKRHQYAGTVRTLEAETVEAWKRLNPEWLAKHWAMGNDGRGIFLGPVNVVPNPKA